jgi:Zn-dependent protease with chaperone function
MSLDSANRSFLAFMSIALLLGAYVLCGALGAVLVPRFLARASDPGLAVPLVLLPLLGAIAVGLARAGRSLARQMLASRRLAQHVCALACTPPDRLARAALQSELGGRVVCVDAPGSFSFAYGSLTPRVAVSRGLLECASSAELRAVLEHERYHVRNLDPLKVVLMRALSAALPLLPALDTLRGRYLASCELAADRRALAVCGRRALASALMKVVRGPRSCELHVAASFGGVELLNMRLTQLETGVAPRPNGFGIARATISLLGPLVLLLALLASASSFGGAAAVHHESGAALVLGTLLASLSCAAPFAGVGLLAYLAIALRARRPLRSRAAQRPRRRPRRPRIDSSRIA